MIASVLAFAIIFALLPMFPGSPAVIKVQADNSVDIDIRDWNNWFVYDHYDVIDGGYASDNPRFNDKRPYFPIEENQSISKNLTTITELLKGGSWRNVHHLDEHISIVEKGDNTDIVFMGYGEKAYTDFLLYPETSGGEKSYGYDIYAMNIDLHTLSSVGYLINAGIDEEGYIHGYVLLIKFTDQTMGGSFNGSSMYLYKINDGVLAANIHHELESAFTNNGSNHALLPEMELPIDGENVILIDDDQDGIPDYLGIRSAGATQKAAYFFGKDGKIAGVTLLSDDLDMKFYDNGMIHFFEGGQPLDINGSRVDAMRINENVSFNDSTVKISNVEVMFNGSGPFKAGTDNNYIPTGNGLYVKSDTIGYWDISFLSGTITVDGVPYPIGWQNSASYVQIYSNSSSIQLYNWQDMGGYWGHSYNNVNLSDVVITFSPDTIIQINDGKHPTPITVDGANTKLQLKNRLGYGNPTDLYVYITMKITEEFKDVRYLNVMRPDYNNGYSEYAEYVSGQSRVIVGDQTYTLDDNNYFIEGNNLYVRGESSFTEYYNWGDYYSIVSGNISLNNGAENIVYDPDKMWIESSYNTGAPMLFVPQSNGIVNAYEIDGVKNSFTPDTVVNIPREPGYEYEHYYPGIVPGNYTLDGTNAYIDKTGNLRIKEKIYRVPLDGTVNYIEIGSKFKLFTGQTVTLDGTDVKFDYINNNGQLIVTGGQVYECHNWSDTTYPLKADLNFNNHYVIPDGVRKFVHKETYGDDDISWNTESGSNRFNIPFTIYSIDGMGDMFAFLPNGTDVYIQNGMLYIFPDGVDSDDTSRVSIFDIDNGNGMEVLPLGETVTDYWDFQFQSGTMTVDGVDYSINHSTESNYVSMNGNYIWLYQYDNDLGYHVGGEGKYISEFEEITFSPDTVIYYYPESKNITLDGTNAWVTRKYNRNNYSVYFCLQLKSDTSVQALLRENGEVAWVAPRYDMSFSYDGNNVTHVGTVSNPGEFFAPDGQKTNALHIGVTFNDDTLSVKSYDPRKSVSERSVVSATFGADDELLSQNTGEWRGFGPFVEYLSHGCSSLSSFRFSNLTMGSVLQHAIIFDKNAEDATAGTVESIELDEGALIGELPSDIDSGAPERVGYNFLGWSKSRNAVTPDFPAGGERMGLGSITVYAVWQAKPVEVNFFLDSDGEEPYDIGNYANADKKFGDKLTNFAEPEEEDSIFLGWFIDPEDDDAEPWDFANPIDTEGPLNLYAKFSQIDDMENYAVLTFDKNADDAVDGLVTSKLVEKDNPAGVLPNANKGDAPTRPGYDFKGWEGENGIPFTAESVISEDTTVYAIWEAKAKIDFDLDGGDFGDVIPPDEADGGVLIIPLEKPAKDGYKFKGWKIKDSDDDTIYEPGDKIDGITDDMTLVAQWEAISTVTVLGSFAGSTGAGAYEPDKSVTIAAGSSADHIFEGWEIKDIYGEPLEVEITSGTLSSQRLTFTMPYGDVIATAKWRENIFVEPPPTYAVRFYGNGGSLGIITPVIIVEDSITIPTEEPTRAGYEFTGWNTEADASGTSYASGDTIENITADISLYAQWNKVICNVTFVSNGGTEVAPQEIVVGRPIAEPTDPIKSEHSFDGWYKDPNFTEKWGFDVNEPVNDDVTLYANWLYIYTLTFNPNGGTAVAPQSVNDGKTALKPEDPTKDGYIIEGWYKDSALTDPWDFDVDTVMGNTMLHAKWNPVDYDIAYDLNDGGSDEALNDINNPMVYNIDDTKSGTLKLNDPTWTGYIFTGWTCDELGLSNPMKDYTIPENTTGNLTFTANWIEIVADVYEIKYNMNGGANDPLNPGYYETSQLSGGVMIYAPPARTGYTFASWTVEYADIDMSAYNGELKDLDLPYVLPADATGDITFTANWDIIQYNVSFIRNYDASDDEIIGDIDVDYKTSLGDEMPDDPERTGYKFKGWNTERDGSGTWFNETTPIDDDIILYAQWEDMIYTVTFESNGGSNVPSENVKYDQTVNAPYTPVKEGYTLDGWYADESLTDYLWNFDTDTVTESITLYAKWTKNIYTVMFETNVDDVAIDSQTLEHGEKVSKPTELTKEGYTFADWYKDAEFNELWDFDTEVVTKNMTLYANWAINVYSVVFDTDGGSDVDPQDVEHDNLVTEPTDPTKDGNTFDGWYKDAEFEEPWDFDTDTVTDNTVIYAKWIADVYEVTFNSNGGSDVDSQDVEHGKKVSKPADSIKDGYVLEGWYKDAELEEPWDFDTDTVTEDITLYANWTEIIIHEVTFDSNGGSAVDSQDVEHGNLAEEPEDPTKDGYVLEGWYKDAELEEPWDFDTDTVTEDTILYAKWVEAEANVYTVIFNSNGGSDVDSQDVEDGSKAAKPTDPTQTGNTFDGWYKDVDLTQPWDFDTDTITEDITLYAKWTVVPTTPQGGDDYFPEQPATPEPTTQPTTEEVTTTEEESTTEEPSEEETTADELGEEDTTEESGEEDTTVEDGSSEDDTTESGDVEDDTVSDDDDNSDDLGFPETTTIGEDFNNDDEQSTTEADDSQTSATETTNADSDTSDSNDSGNTTTTNVITPPANRVVLPPNVELTSGDIELEWLEENATPLSNGWFAVDLGEDWWEIFDDSGVPLGVFNFADYEGNIEDMDVTIIEFNIVPLSNVMTAAEAEAAEKNNPSTGDSLYIILALLVLMSAAGVVIFRKKLVK